MRFKSIYIIDLCEIIEAINKDVLLFSLEYDIKNVNDLTNLFISRVILKMINEYHKIIDAFIFFFINENKKQSLIKEGTFIKYKKFFNLIEKKVKFPLLVDDCDIQNYHNKLKDENVLVEELMKYYKSFSEIYPNIVEVVRKFRYKRIDNEVIKEIKNLIKLISSI